MLHHTNSVWKKKNRHLGNMWLTTKKHMLHLSAKTTLLQPKTSKTITFTAEQLTKFVANVVTQIAQPQVCYPNPKQDTLDLKSSMCRQISNDAKTILNVNITGKDLFESIGSLSASAPLSSSHSRVPKSKQSPKPSAVLESITPPNKSTKPAPKQPITFNHNRYTLINFMGTNILFWICQGIRPKRKELELYLKENVIDVIALNEMFLNKKHNFKIQVMIPSEMTVQLAKEEVLPSLVKMAYL